MQERHPMASIDESVIMLSETARIFFRGIRVRSKGMKRYHGDTESISRQIIRDCYDPKRKYFRVSWEHGHFCEFYARDFGWCAESLLSLGYRKEVISTLDYALDAFQRHGRVEQSISPSGRPFTFPSGKYSPDALAFLVRSLRLAGERKLVAKYKDFLSQEVKRYFELVVDRKSGLVRKDRSFSSMKDYSLRQSSCYDNVMTAMLSLDLDALGLPNPFKRWDYHRLIIKHFWTGEYFLDDLSGSKVVCGDANVLPFWSGLIVDHGLLRKAIASIRKEGLDSPFPLKYTRKRFSSQKMIAKELFAGDYERDAIWPHVGLMYVKVVASLDKRLARRYLAQYEKQMLLHKNFLEVYTRDGKPFKNFFFHADEGMLWVANFMQLKKSL
jgi:hypothetical protein